MKLISDNRPTLPVEDYSVALRNAIQWLAERYLLAVPVKARVPQEKGRRYFLDRQPWNHLAPPGRL